MNRFAADTLLALPDLDYDGYAEAHTQCTADRQQPPRPSLTFSRLLSPSTVCATGYPELLANNNRALFLFGGGPTHDAAWLIYLGAGGVHQDPAQCTSTQPVHLPSAHC